jgi:hypothetical protein
MYDLIWIFVTALWTTLCEMAPYLLFGFLVAGVLSVFISPAFVERHLGGKGIWPVIKATLFGIPLPLCSCGVIPVAASLRRHNATRGATTAFLLSTPQTGVDSILVTFSILGPVFAVFRPLAALVNGIVGGALVTLFDRSANDGAGNTPTVCVDECCADEPSTPKWRLAIRYGFGTLAEDIGKSLLVGIVIAGLIAAVVPEDFFSGALGTGLLSMLVMMLFGIPLYVCATASVPVAAALMLKGVSPGAALVFLITGPATNAATVATIWKIMGKRTAIVYLVTVALTALASGMVLNYIFTFPAINVKEHIHPGTPGYFQIASAIVLLVVLGKAIFLRSSSEPVSGQMSASGEAEQVLLKVDGMTCSHCAQTVERALAECTGVRSAHVDLESGRAVVIGDDLDTGAMVSTVSGLGYPAEAG